MTDLQATIGRAQLDKLPQFIVRRKENFAYLFDGLKQFEEHLQLPVWHEKADPSWFAFPLLVPETASFSRYDITRFLEEHKLETRTLFAGNILKQPAYQDVSKRQVGDLPVADLIMRGAFFIGVYPGLDRRHLDYMIETFEAFFRQV